MISWALLTVLGGSLKDLKKFPPEHVLKHFRDKLSSPSYKKSSIALPEDASEVDRAKYEVCQLITKFHLRNKLKQKELAAKLGIDASRMSDILRGKIDSFTLDRLLGYAEKLHPRLKLKIVAA